MISYVWMAAVEPEPGGGQVTGLIFQKGLADKINCWHL